MIPALTKKLSACRPATVGLVALLIAGCGAIPALSPTPSPTPLPTLAPTLASYTLGPSLSPSPYDTCPTSAPDALSGTATVKITTNFGDITIKVDANLGAHAAGAFVALAKCGYYNNVIFHRVVKDQFIQAGDGTYGRMPNPTLSYKLGSGGPNWTISDDKVTTSYKRGTIAMANLGAADTGNSQFFIVLSDTAFPAGTTGYAIFGDVTSGLDVCDRIGNVPTGGSPDQAAGGVPSMPVVPVIITSTIVSTP